MTTSIVIVSYNSFDIIEQCLGELIDCGRYPVIIIDNASPDGSADKLALRFPDTRVVALNKNNGYGRAANVGFKMAGTDYFFLINPDMLISPEDVLKIERRMDSLPDDVALLAPAVRIKDYTRKGVRDTGWVIGAAMLFRRSAMEGIGYFDENIFLFSEETDLCLRIRQAGKRICLDTDVFMKHLSKQSTPTSPELDWVKYWHFGWSNQYFLAKHKLAKGKQNPFRTLFLYGLKSVISTNKRKRLEYRAKFFGTRAFLKGIPAFDESGLPQQSCYLGGRVLSDSIVPHKSPSGIQKNR